MYDDYADTMQELYDTLKFDRAQQARVVSPSGSDWTFLVYVIRYEFLKLQLPAGTKQAIRDAALSMQLLDQMEREIIAWYNDNRTPSPNAVPRGKDTPEPDKDPYNDYYWFRQVAQLPEPSIDLMLARLHDFIE